MHTYSRSSRARRFSDLSQPRQALIRICQITNFGSLRGLEIREREPVFDPPPLLLVDMKLDGGDPPRPEIELADFDLSQEVVRLMDRLDQLVTTKIDLLEIRAGIPRRVVFTAEVEPASTRFLPTSHAKDSQC
jgi:hypothetical protein